MQGRNRGKQGEWRQQDQIGTAKSADVWALGGSGAGAVATEERALNGGRVVHVHVDVHVARYLCDVEFWCMDNIGPRLNVDTTEMHTLYGTMSYQNLYCGGYLPLSLLSIFVSRRRRLYKACTMVALKDLVPVIYLAWPTFVHLSQSLFYSPNNLLTLFSTLSFSGS